MNSLQHGTTSTSSMVLAPFHTRGSIVTQHHDSTQSAPRAYIHQRVYD